MPYEQSRHAIRVMRLTLLAPDIVEAIVRGNEASGLSLERLTKKVRPLWETQRVKFGFGSSKR